MNLVGEKTLILTTNTVAVRQWREELLDKTDLRPDQVGEYTGDEKSVCAGDDLDLPDAHLAAPKAGEFEHFELFSRENWGLIIYDEVHLLPAPVFRVTADLQARRRLGLTATLVREDGKEDEVFCLIGPKRFDVPWKVLEGQGFIAAGDLHRGARAARADAALDLRRRRRARQVPRRQREPGQAAPWSSSSSSATAARTCWSSASTSTSWTRWRATSQAPLITGKTPTAERERLYAGFKSGAIPLLVVSKVGNFAIDLPDANVAIQISGTFGSRQEEAQRLGRILRPKSDGSGAVFYSVVTLGSRDQDFAQKRQLFLTEQGYAYEIVESQALGAPSAGMPRHERRHNGNAVRRRRQRTARARGACARGGAPWARCARATCPSSTASGRARTQGRIPEDRELLRRQVLEWMADARIVAERVGALGKRLQAVLEHHLDAPRYQCSFPELINARALSYLSSYDLEATLLALQRHALVVESRSQAALEYGTRAFAVPADLGDTLVRRGARGGAA